MERCCREMAAGRQAAQGERRRDETRRGATLVCKKEFSVDAFPLAVVILSHRCLLRQYNGQKNIKVNAIARMLCALYDAECLS